MMIVATVVATLGVSVAPAAAGSVYNGTHERLRIATLQGSAWCYVFDPLPPRNFWNRCASTVLPANNWSHRYMRDVDALGFPHTHWYYGPLRIPAGKYLKIRDPQSVICTQARYFFAPRCVG